MAPCTCRRPLCKVCKECPRCSCECNGSRRPIKRRRTGIKKPPPPPRESLTRCAKDSEEVVERKKIAVASLTEPDNVFTPGIVAPKIREIESLQDVFDALALNGTISSLPNFDFRERFTHEDDEKPRFFTAMTRLFGEAIEKIARFFTPNGTEALIKCTLDAATAAIQRSPMNSLIQVLAQFARTSIEGRVARAIIVHATNGTARELATIDGKDIITLGKTARQSGAKDFESLVAGKSVEREMFSRRRVNPQSAKNAAAALPVSEENVVQNTDPPVAQDVLPVALPVPDEEHVEQSSTDTLTHTRVTLNRIREDFDQQRAANPNLVLSADTFDVILRDLEEAAGIR
jgi:hypothetical protein